MLISHTLRYLPAQVLAPVAQLVSMVLWTHWLAPADMGVFTLVTVAQEMAYVFGLGWFSVYALRYLPAAGDLDARRRYLGTENAVVAASLLAGLVAAALTAWTLPSHGSLDVEIGVIALFFITRAINAHYAERARAQSSFVAYTLLQVAGPVGGLVLGLVAFGHFTPSAWVLLAAYAAAQALGAAVALPMLGMHARIGRPDAQLLRAALAFGGPMIGLGVLGWVAENYIRYVVQWQSGAAALGLMIVGWSLGRRCAGVASMLVATAAFPLASRLLNEGRRTEALAQLSTNAGLMLAVLLPVTVAVEVLGSALVTVSVAEEYRQLTTELLGLAVLGGALRNLHVHVSDQLLVLDRQLPTVAGIDLIEIGVCGAASLLGLAWYGLHGAVAGQAVGSAVTLVVSVWLARRRCGFAWPWVATLKVLLASGLMGVALLVLDPAPSVMGLVTGAGLGSLVYALASGLLFAPQLRSLWAQRGL